MATTAKTAIIKSKIEDVIYELMIKTDAANVYVDESTTLASKLSSIIADIATKASVTDLTNGLATKAATNHTHAQADVTGLTDALATLATTASVTSAIDSLRQEMLGDTPVDAYNTFTELAAYIAEHKEVSDALSAAIGNKADKATTISGYGITDAYTKTEVDTKISEVSDTIADYKTSNDTAISNLKNDYNEYKISSQADIDALNAAKHTHDNQTVLDGIAASNVSSWNGKSKIYFSTTEPSDLTSNDLWVNIVE